MDKVSVIIPIFNAESTLISCTRSVCSQSYANLEIILIDDGSVDNSLEICKDYAKTDDRIIVRSKKNSGVSETRNLGISLASGKYLLFVDSDDYIEVDMVEKLLESINKSKSDVVIAGFKEFVKTERLDYLGECLPGEGKTVDKSEFLSILGSLLRKRVLGGPCNSLYKTGVIKQNSIKFPVGISYGEDTIFNMQYYRVANSFTLINESFYNYVHSNPESLSAKSIDNKFAMINAIYKEIRQTFEQCNCNSRDKNIDALYLYHAYKAIEKKGSINYNKTKQNVIMICEDPDVKKCEVISMNNLGFYTAFLSVLTKYRMIHIISLLILAKNILRYKQRGTI